MPVRARFRPHQRGFGFLTPVAAGYLLGSAAAEELGLTSGLRAATAGMPPVPVTVMAPAERNQLAGRWVLDLIPASSTFEQCWAEFQPDAAGAETTMLAAAFPDADIAARPLVRVDGEFARDPVVDLAGRPQATAWLPVGVVLATLRALLSLARRSDVAVYRAYGLPRLGVLLLVQVETVVTVISRISDCWSSGSSPRASTCSSSTSPSRTSPRTSTARAWPACPGSSTRTRSCSRRCWCPPGAGPTEPA